MVVCPDISGRFPLVLLLDQSVVVVAQSQVPPTIRLSPDAVGAVDKRARTGTVPRGVRDARPDTAKPVVFAQKNIRKQQKKLVARVNVVSLLISLPHTALVRLTATHS